MGSTGSSGGGAVELIATQTLAAPAAGIYLTGIPQTYKDLELRVLARSTYAAVTDNLAIQFNADGSADYEYVYAPIASGTLSGATSSSVTYGYVGDVPAASEAAGYFGSYDIEVPEYATVGLFKVYRSFGSISVPSSNEPQMYLSNGQWSKSDPITQLTVFTVSSDLSAGTTVSLYGRS